VFLCLPAYYVKWHMRQKLAPILLDDEDKEASLRQLRRISAPPGLVFCPSASCQMGYISVICAPFGSLQPAKISAPSDSLILLSCLASRPSPIAKAPRSDKAKANDALKQTEDGQPGPAFHTLIADPGTLCLIEAIAVTNPNHALAITTRPTASWKTALNQPGAFINGGAEPVRSSRCTQ
jgi:hypothetical protein